MLKVKHLSLIKSKKAILNNISLDIPLKRISLILGKSGSGKTTFLRSMAQIEQDYTGEIALNDQNLRSISSQKRCRLIGFVPQFFALFPHLTVRDNCAQPLFIHTKLCKDEIYSQVEETLAHLDMSKFASFRPHELSGGQQQRASIARSLMLNPEFMLFDEPTSALDPENTELFIQIIKKLQKEGRGVVIASQDMPFASQILDLAFFLEDGCLLENHDADQAYELACHSKIRHFFSKQRVEIVKSISSVK